MSFFQSNLSILSYFNTWQLPFLPNIWIYRNIISAISTNNLPIVITLSDFIISSINSGNTLISWTFIGYSSKEFSCSWRLRLYVFLNTLSFFISFIFHPLTSINLNPCTVYCNDNIFGLIPCYLYLLFLYPTCLSCCGL